MIKQNRVPWKPVCFPNSLTPSSLFAILMYEQSELGFFFFFFFFLTHQKFFKVVIFYFCVWGEALRARWWWRWCVGVGLRVC